MTQLLPIGTPVTVSSTSYASHRGRNDLVVLAHTVPGNYGIGPAHHDPTKDHSSADGWLAYHPEYVTAKNTPTPEAKETKVTQFNVGDKVEFTENYPKGAPRVFKGAKATVYRRNDADDLVWLTVDADGTTEGVFSYRLKLAEVVKPEFKAGDTVTFHEEGNVHWQGGKGTVLEVVTYSTRSPHYRVKMIDSPPLNTVYTSGSIVSVTAQTLRAVPEAKAPTAFTYEDVQIGDTIRRTKTFPNGSTEVREGTVKKIGSYYKADSGSFILAYDDSSQDGTGVVLELLNRVVPEPKPEPKITDGAKAGDQILSVLSYNDVRKLYTKGDDGLWQAVVIREGSVHKGFTWSDDFLNGEAERPTITMTRVK